MLALREEKAKCRVLGAREEGSSQLGWREVWTEHRREQAFGGSASLKGISSVEWHEEGRQKSQMSLGKNWKGSVPESLSGALLG